MMAPALGITLLWPGLPLLLLPLLVVHFDVNMVDIVATDHPHTIFHNCLDVLVLIQIESIYEHAYPSLLPDDLVHDSTGGDNGGADVTENDDGGDAPTGRRADNGIKGIISAIFGKQASCGSA
jgi:hypothetical protein